MCDLVHLCTFLPNPCWHLLLQVPYSAAAAEARLHFEQKKPPLLKGISLHVVEPEAQTPQISNRVAALKRTAIAHGAKVCNVVELPAYPFDYVWPVATTQQETPRRAYPMFFKSARGSYIFFWTPPYRSLVVPALSVVMSSLIARRCLQMTGLRSCSLCIVMHGSKRASEASSSSCQLVTEEWLLSLAESFTVPLEEHPYRVITS